ncbi:DNA helicase, partial [Tanacetum coccineum]
FFFHTTDDNIFNGGSIQEDTPISEESIERRETPSADVRVSNITVDDNLFNGGSIQEDTPISKESIERREMPSVDVQIIRIGGNVNTRLSTGGHDMVPKTTVPVSRIFDHFRNMRLNSLGSDYMSHADNRVELIYLNLCATPITDEVLVPNVHKRGCLHTVSTASSLEEIIQRNTIRTQDFLSHTASSSRMAPNERLKGNDYGGRDEYHLCCGGGKIYMPLTPDPPVFIQQLLRNSHFMEHVRAYNQMFSMTSFGEKIDDSVNRGRGPYVFKVSGQIYHWIGSLCPEEGTLNPEIVKGLIHVLDEHNGLVRLFRTARDKCSAGEIPGFKIRLYNKGGIRGYELPTSDILGGIIFEDGPNSRTDFDVIIEFRGGPPQRINKLHQSYMSLQFPLLFIFSQPGFYPDLVLKPRDVFCVMEQSRLDWVRNHQNDLRSNYLLVLYKIEFQKRGLPHCHTLLWVDSSSKLRDVVEINECISAEIPDPVEDPKGYKVVIELMMHGPCGVANPGVLYTENGACNKHFPKRYNENTFFDINGHTHYRRRQTEVHIMKGESRIFDFPIHRREPAVQILNVHLENMQRVTFRERDRLDIIVNMPGKKKTTLTEWYVYNSENIDGRHLTYLDFPSEFVWYPNSKSWRQRVMVLCHQKGCKSLTEVQTVNGHVLPTYRAACEALGIVSILLPAERTAHFRFKLPLDLTNESVCQAKKHSQLANFLIETHLIIWDEAPMNDRHCFEALDITLRDLMNAPKILFGGKTIVLGESYLWLHFKICKLKENMRLMRPGLGNEERESFKIFAKWLLDVGNGEIGEPDEDNDEDTSWITIPQQYCLTPDAVNAKILSIIEGATKTYLSRDEAILIGRETRETKLLYPMEYLNTITFPGFPPHELQLKVGSPIMMLRNVNLSGGLCNGTRMIVTALMSRLIELVKQFIKDEIEKLPRPIIIAVSSCRISKYRDVKLETTPSTFYYINSQTQEAANAYTIFKERYEFNPPLQVYKYRYVDPEQEKTRNWQTLYTLLQQDPTSYKEVRFTCEAMITNLNKNRRWNYVSCSQCNKDSTKTDGAYTCEDHGKQDPPTYRYNFKATVTDGTAIVEFTFFTEASQQITGLMINESTSKDKGVDTESSTSTTLTTKDSTNKDKSIPESAAPTSSRSNSMPVLAMSL